MIHHVGPEVVVDLHVVPEVRGGVGAVVVVVDHCDALDAIAGRDRHVDCLAAAGEVGVAGDRHHSVLVAERQLVEAVDGLVALLDVRYIVD